MQIRRRLFGRRVAARVLVSLVVASAVPLVAIALLAVTYVERTLEARARDALTAATSSYGQDVLARLAWMANVLPRAESERAPVGDTAALAGFATVFTGTRLDFGLPAEPPADGVPELLVRRSDAEAQVLIALPRGRRGGVVVGRLDPDYLFRGAALLGQGIAVCVLARGVEQPLYCSAAVPAGVARGFAERWLRNSSGVAEWKDSDGGEWLAAYRELAVASSFHGAPWLIVASEPRATALGALAELERLLWYAGFAAALAVVLLGVSQVRKITKPLGRLLQGARRLQQGDFDARVSVRAGDEFAELGAAMNAVLDTLGREVATLRAFAAVDRVLLSSRAIETLLQAVLDAAQSLVPHAHVAVLLIDARNRRRAKLYAPAAADGQRRRLQTLDVDLAGSWPAASSGFVGAKELEDLGLPPLDRSLPGAYVAPIGSAESCAGAVLAASTESTPLAAHESNALNELAGRLAVAIAAAEREQELFARAHLDMLTGLPNRHLCEDRLSQALARARRDGHKLAILFIDLDGFKAVNDSLGHAAGDSLLREIALRLKAAVRDTDTVARLGGDEYLVVLPHVHDSLEVETLVESLLADLRQPFSIRNREARVSASIGITIFPDDGQTAEELLSRADAAMYRAKDVGRARAVFFAKAEEQLRDRLATHD